MAVQQIDHGGVRQQFVHAVVKVELGFCLRHQGSAIGDLIEKLEREKLVLAEKAAQSVPPQGRLEEVIEHALAFLANPWHIYEKGSFALKRTVLKLAFVEPLRYSRFEGYRTAETTFPFKVLAGFYNNGCGLVEPRGLYEIEH